MSYRRPFPDNTIPTGGVFGDRTPPRTTGHRGTDWSHFKGARGAIPCITASTFVASGKSSSVGWWVELLGSDGVYSTYCHMAAQSPLAGLKFGQAVPIDTTVGTVGATGSAARGPHLHLAMSRVKGGGLSAAFTKLIDPHAHILANLAAPAAHNQTDLEEDDMKNILIRNGNTGLVVLSDTLLSKWVPLAKDYPELLAGWGLIDEKDGMRKPNLDVPDNIFGYLQSIATAPRWSSVDVPALVKAIVAGINTRVGTGTVDPGELTAQIVAAVEGALADNFAAIPDAVIAEELARLAS